MLALTDSPWKRNSKLTTGDFAVIEGMDLVMKIEAAGSPSGAPKKKVVIKDSGELPKSTTQY